MKILYADDKKNWHILFENVLKERGIKVLHAYTSKDVIEKISQERPNVVILDMTLRDSSALDVLPDIAKEKLPVLVIGYRKEGLDEERLKSYGASRVLQKPFTVNELLAVLEELKEGTLVRRERVLEHEEEEKLEIVLPEEATVSPSEQEELEILEIEPEEMEVQPEQLSQVQEEQQPVKPAKEKTLSTSVAATSTEISKEELKEILKPEIENLIREIVWEVVPEIAEKVIREEIEKLVKSRLA